MTEFLRDQASDSEEVPRKDKEIESRMLQGNFYTNKKKRNRKSGKEDEEKLLELEQQTVNAWSGYSCRTLTSGTSK